MPGRQPMLRAQRVGHLARDDAVAASVGVIAIAADEQSCERIALARGGPERLDDIQVSDAERLDRGSQALDRRARIALEVDLTLVRQKEHDHARADRVALADDALQALALLLHPLGRTAVALPRLGRLLLDRLEVGVAVELVQ